ncbi:hypothetical protein B0H11DRAFT_1933436 [Mycena galericulata]|nr:hypothetical protein B0H11DRAFT_1933436 [Mycena galericulata]
MSWWGSSPLPDLTVASCSQASFDEARTSEIETVAIRVDVISTCTMLDSKPNMLSTPDPPRLLAASRDPAAINPPWPWRPLRSRRGARGDCYLPTPISWENESGWIDSGELLSAASLLSTREMELFAAGLHLERRRNIPFLRRVIVVASFELDLNAGALVQCSESGVGRTLTKYKLICHPVLFHLPHMRSIAFFGDICLSRSKFSRESREIARCSGCENNIRDRELSVLQGSAAVSTRDPARELQRKKARVVYIRSPILLGPLLFRSGKFRVLDRVHMSSTDLVRSYIVHNQQTPHRPGVILRPPRGRRRRTESGGAVYRRAKWTRLKIVVVSKDSEWGKQQDQTRGKERWLSRQRWENQDESKTSMHRKEGARDRPLYVGDGKEGAGVVDVVRGVEAATQTGACGRAMHRKIGAGRGARGRRALASARSWDTKAASGGRMKLEQRGNGGGSGGGGPAALTDTWVMAHDARRLRHEDLNTRFSRGLSYCGGKDRVVEEGVSGPLYSPTPKGRRRTTTTLRDYSPSCWLNLQAAKGWAASRRWTYSENGIRTFDGSSSRPTLSTAAVSKEKYGHISFVRSPQESLITHLEGIRWREYPTDDPYYGPIPSKSSRVAEVQNAKEKRRELRL